MCGSSGGVVDVNSGVREGSPSVTRDVRLLSCCDHGCIRFAMLMPSYFYVLLFARLMKTYSTKPTIRLLGGSPSEHVLF